MLEKVISGGQSGADVAGLRAAKAMGIATGGTMPKGWLTEDGPHPEYADLYGMVECDRAGYPARTAANVKSADLCLLLYAERQEHSAGTNLTRLLCREHGVERFEVTFYLVGFGKHPGLGNWRANELRSAAAADTIRRVRPTTLMVAGNRESKAPGIGAAAEAFLRDVFSSLKE